MNIHIDLFWDESIQHMGAGWPLWSSDYIPVESFSPVIPLQLNASTAPSFCMPGRLIPPTRLSLHIT